MNSMVGTMYWVRLGLLVLLAVLAIVVGLRLMRTRRFSMGRGIAVVVLELVALLGLWLLTGASPSLIWIVVMLAVGGVLGFVLGRSAKPAGDALRRTPLAALITALAFIFAAMTMLFGTSYLFSISLLGIALALGALAGQLFGEMQAAKGSYAGVEPPPMPVQAPPMPVTTPEPSGPPPFPAQAPPFPGEPPA